MWLYIAGSDEADISHSKSKTLFGENYTRLQELKERYDPANVFNKWFAVAPSSASGQALA